jgi:hypothetical protein
MSEEAPTELVAILEPISQPADVAVPVPTVAPPPSPVPIDPRITDVVALYKEVDWKNPVPTTLKLAQHFETLDGLSASEKLHLLQASMTYLAKQLPDEEQPAALGFVNTTLPHVFETAVAVSNGGFTLKKAAEVVTAVIAQPEMKAVVEVALPQVEAVAVSLFSRFCGPKVPKA